MHDHPAVSLILRAVYDEQREAVGLFAEASKGFEEGDDTRAKVEVLAAITAKANSIAAEVIRSWPADETRKQELYTHYTALKEEMLNDMLGQVERASPAGPDPA